MEIGWGDDTGSNRLESAAIELDVLRLARFRDSAHSI
jgi:hypothetical protein